MSTCFICGLSLQEGETILVKEKGVQTLRLSSTALKNSDNELLLRHLKHICIHTSCKKRYNNPKLIKAAVQRGERDLKKKKRTTRASSEQFNFKDHCFLCGEVISAEFIEAQKKCSPEKRNTVHTVVKITMSENVIRAAEKRGDEWAIKIKERISEETDLVALHARYHLLCQRKLYKPPSKG